MEAFHPICPDPTAGLRAGAHDERTRWLAFLSQGEGEAAQALRDLLDGTPNGSPTSHAPLEILWRDHLEAAQLLSARLGEDGPAPGFVAAWPHRLTSQPRRTIEALHAAETAWVQAYERALLGGDLDGSDGALILSILLPRQRAHPPLLERALASA